MDYDSYKLMTPPQFEEETEDEYIDCELCGDAFLVENMQHLREYNCVCQECIKLEIENKC